MRGPVGSLDVAVEATVGATSLAMLLFGFAQSPKSFRPPSEDELLSLCVVKEKVTKEKGHPAWGRPGHLPGKCVSRGRAFRQHIPVPAQRHRLRATAPALTQLGHPCPRHADARCAACRPRLTATQGARVEQLAILARTRYAAAVRLRRQGQKQRQSQWPELLGSPGFDLAFALALPKSARRSALLYPGPLCGGAGQRTGPQGDRRGCRSFFARTGVLSKNPAAPHGLAGHGYPASAKRGVVFSWLLLCYSGHPALRPSGQLRCSSALQARMWTSKREVTRPPQEDESSLLDPKQARSSLRQWSRPLSLQPCHDRRGFERGLLRSAPC